MMHVIIHIIMMSSRCQIPFNGLRVRAGKYDPVFSVSGDD